MKLSPWTWCTVFCLCMWAMFVWFMGWPGMFIFAGYLGVALIGGPESP